MVVFIDSIFNSNSYIYKNIIMKIYNGGSSVVVNTSVCGSEDREFDSRLPPLLHKKEVKYG